jgi:hypothetical protein
VHTITTVLFDDNDIHTLSRIVPLLPLAYPSSDQPPHLRPSGVAAVDVRDARLRVVPAICEQAYRPLTYPQVLLASEVLDTLTTVVGEQVDADWWRALVHGRTLGEDDEKMAAAMAAERGGQLRRVATAREVIARALDSLTPLDDPTYWQDNTEERLDADV